MSEAKDLWESIVKTAEYVSQGKDAEEYGLDFSEESVIGLDDMLEDLWGEEGPSEENWDSMVWAFGSYIAVVISRHFNGDWARNEESGEIVFEAETAGVGLNPFSWVAKKFDTQDSLKSNYDFITNMMKEDRKPQ